MGRSNAQSLFALLLVGFDVWAPNAYMVYADYLKMQDWGSILTAIGFDL